MQEVINLIKKLAIQENKTDVSMICKIAASMMFKSNRNLFQIFKNLEEDPENYMADFKFKLSMKEAINMKIKMKLTVEQYRMLKKVHSTHNSTHNSWTFNCQFKLVLRDKLAYKYTICRLCSERVSCVAGVVFCDYRMLPSMSIHLPSTHPRK